MRIAVCDDETAVLKLVSVFIRTEFENRNRRKKRYFRNRRMEYADCGYRYKSAWGIR